MNFKSIISSYTDEFYVSTPFYTATKVIIKPKYSSQWQTTTTQLLVDFSVALLSEEAKSAIQSCLDKYNTMSLGSDSCVKINYTRTTILNGKLHLVLLLQCPLNISVGNYYKDFVSYEERVFHSHQLNKIANKTREIQLEGFDSSIQNGGIGLFSVYTSPFPEFKMTPFGVLNSKLSSLKDSVKSNTVQGKFFNDTFTCSFASCEYSLVEYILNTIGSTSSRNVEKDWYLPVNELGSGNYGKVYRGIKTVYNGQRVVINSDGTCNLGKTQSVVFKESTGRNRLFLTKEETLLAITKHENVIHYEGSYEDCNAKVLILEECQMDLAKYIEKAKKNNMVIGKTQISEIMSGVRNAMVYLYRNFGVIHRDIKLENILINEEKSLKVKLCDFGLCIKATESMDSLVGTPLYASPQIIRKDKYTSKSDLYSAGVVLYYLLYGKLPFLCETEKELLAKYNEELYFEKKGEEFSQLIEIDKKLLQIEENTRMSWDQFEKMTF
ncbi:serine/threonine protein kinase, putative [Entamoeba invadens IP1]|uniref:Serine/threonine protein kinase, putative n=1 Tax=Entamoeba invadens IP1 TaxID=370355 RepID=A0A0A1UB51_ENTIV|nr:serine/threonine protein kinase, putative [Entamoeba invadens IP1]ELP92432.1 serine/threonine protein kinase, putative [Entamoeba invadens IP1]|eukprot:XP_004259203.1 serine/threonine protein kinase, putative [Entamoeba invadens IP1]